MTVLRNGKEGVIPCFQKLHVCLSLDAYAGLVAIPAFFLNQRNSSRLKLVMRTSSDVSKGTNAIVMSEY